MGLNRLIIFTLACFSLSAAYALDVQTAPQVASVPVGTPVVLETTITGASGSLDAWLPDAGRVVIEAETWAANELNGDPNGQLPVAGSALSGFSGSGYRDIPLGDQTIANYGAAASSSYPFVISSAGTYGVHLRVAGSNHNTNSTFVAIDGSQLGNFATSSTWDSWHWVRFEDVALDAGEHSLELIRREAGYRVDKIVITADLNETFTDLGPAAVDRYAGPSFVWQLDGNPAPWPAVAQPAWVPADTGSYSYTVELTNFLGDTASASGSFSVVENSPSPVAVTIDVDFSGLYIALDDSVQLTAVPSPAPAGTFSYSWTSDRLGFLGNDEQFVIPSLSEGAHTITCVLTDSASATAVAQTVLQVYPVNQPPVVDAGIARKVWIPESVPLLGSVSDDGLAPGVPLNIYWEAVSGPDIASVQFADTSSPTSGVTFTVPGTYVLALNAFDGEFHQSSETTITVREDHTAPVVLTVDVDDHHQTMIGFGATAVFYGDLKDLWDSPTYVNTIARDLGASYYRVAMRATLLENEITDPEDIGPEDLDWSDVQNAGELATKLAAASLDTLTVSGAIWSPPAWMKSNNRVTDGGQLRFDRYRHFGKYVAAMVEGFEQEYGVPMNAFSVQNEPVFLQWYQSCVYPTYRTWYRDAIIATGRALDEAGVQTRLIGPEDVGFFYNRSFAYLRSVMTHREASQYFGAPALHHWAESTKSNLPNAQGYLDFRAVTDPYEIGGIWQSESAAGPNLWPDISYHGTERSDWSVFRLADRIHYALVYGNAPVWAHWQFTDRAHNENEALMIEGNKGPKYHVAKNWYRYIRPGAVRVGISPDGNEVDGVLVSAFTLSRDDTATATIVAYNKSPYPRTVHVDGLSGLPASTTDMVQYVSSAVHEHELFATIGTDSDNNGFMDNAIAVTLPPYSISTLFTTWDVGAVGVPDHSVEAGEHQQLPFTAGMSVQLAGSASGNAQWEIASGPVGGVIFADPTNPQTTATISVPGKYTLRLRSQSGQLWSTSDTCFVTAHAAPMVALNGPATTGVDEAIEITASISDDGFPTKPGGTRIRWEIVDLSGSDASTVFPTEYTEENTSFDFTTTFTPRAAGTYTIRSIVDDGHLETIQDHTVVVTSGGTMVVQAQVTPASPLASDTIGFVPVVAGFTDYSGAHVQSGDNIVIEAELFNSTDLNGDPNGEVHQAQSAIPGFTGSGYAVVPSGQGPIIAGYNQGAKAQYTLLVTKPGTFQIWLRGMATGYDDNSHYMVINGQQIKARKVDNEIKTFEFMTFDSAADWATWQWWWHDEVTLEAGVHTLELMRREPGLLLDRVVLTQAPLWLTGSETGPAATPVAGPTQLAWTVDGAPLVGDTPTIGGLGSGFHTATLTATDALGNTVSDSVHFEVRGNLAPAVTIIEPLTETVDRSLQGFDISLLADATDPDGDSLTVSWSSNVDGFLGDSTTLSGVNLSYGFHDISVTVTDPSGASAVAEKTIYVTDLDGPRFVHGVRGAVGEAWQDIIFPVAYEDTPVVVATPSYGEGVSPGVVRIRDVSKFGFQLRMQSTEGLFLPAYDDSRSVHWLAMAAGTYSTSEHGITAEARYVTPDKMNYKGNWSLDPFAAQQLYSTPVVLGQAVGDNESWQAFWAAGSRQNNPPTFDDIRVGVHRAEAGDATDLDAIALIIIETVDTVSAGVPMFAELTADTVKGFSNPGSGISWSRAHVPTTVVGAMAGMDGSDGGWPVWLDGPTNGGLLGVVDEDQSSDGERSHTTEQLGIIGLGSHKYFRPYYY